QPGSVPALAALALIADVGGDAHAIAQRFTALGDAWAQAGDRDDAAAAWRTAAQAWLEIDPARATAFCEHIHPDLERAVELDDSQPEAWEALAHARLATEPRSALEAADRAARLYDERGAHARLARASLCAAGACERLGDDAGALERYRRVQAITPGDELYGHVARVCERLGRVEEALTALTVLEQRAR